MHYTYTDGEHVIDMLSDILKIASFILFGIAYVLALSYLNSLSLAKECLLVYLYKDVLSMMLSWRTFLAIEVILNTFYRITHMILVLFYIVVFPNGFIF